MITMTFNEFLSGDNFPGGDSLQLYAVRNCKDILYIGISKTHVWNRWFCERKSHMYFAQKYSGTPEGGKWVGSSPIGHEIAGNFPESREWEFDLWSLRDGLDFLKIDYGCTGTLFSIKEVEQKMIGLLSPKFNIAHNHNDDKDVIAKGRAGYFSFLETRCRVAGAGE